MRLQESNLQKACVSWFRYQYPDLTLLLFAVPNGGSRNPIEAVRLKAEGVVSGVADIILLTPNKQYPSLAIELKANNKCKQSDNQKKWQLSCEKVGNKYVVVHSIDEFMFEVADYLNNR